MWKRNKAALKEQKTGLEEKGLAPRRRLVKAATWMEGKRARERLVSFSPTNHPPFEVDRSGSSP